MILRGGRVSSTRGFGGTAAAVVGMLLLAGCGSDHAAAPKSARADVVRLQKLERPLLRSIKETFAAAHTKRDRLAQARLKSAALEAEAVLRWLDGHASFVRANRDSLSCLDDPLHEIGEDADQLGPLLGQHAVTPPQRKRLEHTLAEAANCIEASD